MNMAEKATQYTATVKVSVIVEVPLPGAKTLEEALAMAKALRIGNVIKPARIGASFIDTGAPEIVGVSSDAWL